MRYLLIAGLVGLAACQTSTGPSEKPSFSGGKPCWFPQVCEPDTAPPVPKPHGN